MSLSKPRKYSAEDLENAFREAAVVGQREACRLYNVPLATLQRKIERGDPSFVQRGVKPALSKEIEAEILEAVLTFKEIGFGLTRVAVRRIAKAADNLRPIGSRVFRNDLPSNCWFQCFKKRHGLTMRSPENKSISRWSMEAEEVRTDLFNLLTDLVSKHSLSASDIFNVDETGLQIVTKNPKILTMRGDRQVYVRKAGERSETISLAVCGNANGTVILPPFVIFKGSSLSSDLNPEHYPDDTTFSHTKSGYMVSDLFEVWFEEFLRRAPAKRPLMLILDGHGSHVSLPVILKAKYSDVILLCLPPHTSHLFQPMDVGVFCSLKSNFQIAVENRCKILGHAKATRRNFGKLLSDAWEQSVTPKNVKGGFRHSGIWPIDKDAAPRSTSSPNSSPNSSTLSVTGNESTISSNDDSLTRSLTLNSPILNTNLQTATSTPLAAPDQPETGHASLNQPTASSVADIIRQMFKGSPQKPAPQTSKRITVARCLTSDEYIKMLQDREKTKKQKEETKKQKEETKKQKEETKKQKEARKNEKNKKEPKKLKRKNSNDVSEIHQERLDEEKVDDLDAVDMLAASGSNYVPVNKRKKRADKTGQSKTKDLGQENVTMNDLNEGDFVVVQFKSEDGKERRFIGKIESITGDEVNCDFLRVKFTKEHLGYVFTYPIIPDKAACAIAQIKKKLATPKMLRRGELLFEVHSNCL